MKEKSRLKSLILLLSLGLFSTGLMSQTIITIDNNAGSTTTYTTIQAAHDAASPGDIIYVQPSGTSYGNVTVDKPLTIIGRSHYEPNKYSQLTTVIVRSSDVNLKGLRINNQVYTQESGSPNAIPFVGLNVNECFIQNGITLGSNIPTLQIDDVQLRGNVLRGNITCYNDASDIIVSNNIITATNISVYSPTGIIFSNNVFRRTSTGTNFYNYGGGSPLILYNSIFTFNANGTSSSTAVVDFQAGAVNLSNSLTYNYGTGNPVTFFVCPSCTLNESGTIANTDPLFTDVDPTVSQSFAGSSSYNPGIRLDDDLTLQATSPALTGGGGGSEIGLHNSGFRYQMLGNPRGFPLLDVQTYDATVPKNANLNATIKGVAK